MQIIGNLETLLRLHIVRWVWHLMSNNSRSIFVFFYAWIHWWIWMAIVVTANCSFWKKKNITNTHSYTYLMCQNIIIIIIMRLFFYCYKWKLAQRPISICLSLNCPNKISNSMNSFHWHSSTINRRLVPSYQQISESQIITIWMSK